MHDGREMTQALLDRPLYDEALAAQVLKLSPSTLHWWLEGGVRNGRSYSRCCAEHLPANTSLPGARSWRPATSGSIAGLSVSGYLTFGRSLLTSGTSSTFRTRLRVLALGSALAGDCLWTPKCAGGSPTGALGVCRASHSG